MRFLGRSITLDDHAPALLLLRIVLFLENLVPVAFFFVGVVGLPLEDFESSPGQSICGSFCAPGGSNNRRPKNGILPPVWFKLQALSVPNRSAHVCKQRNRDHCRIAPHTLRCCFHKSPHVLGECIDRIAGQPSGRRRNGKTRNCSGMCFSGVPSALEGGVDLPLRKSCSGRCTTQGVVDLLFGESIGVQLTKGEGRLI